MDLEKVFNNIPSYLQADEVLIAQFCTNLSKLEEFFPDLYERFYLYTPKRPFAFIKEVDSSYNIGFINENIKLYPAPPAEFSRTHVDAFMQQSVAQTYNYYKQYDYFGAFHYKYSNECADFMATLNRKRLNLVQCPHMPVCSMYGCGLGYHIQELFSKVDIANLILVETDEDIFYASLFTFNWSAFLSFLKENGCGFKIIIDNDIDRIVKDYTDYIVRYGRFLTFYYLPFNFRSSSLHTKIHEVVDHKLKYELTALSFIDDHLFATSHSAINLINKRPLLSVNRHLADDLKKTPVFIVANGPSLSNDIEFLQRNQDKALIIACGTAIDTLYNSGIKPDFYAATERTCDIIPTVEIFNKDGFLDDIVLLASEVVHPKMSALFKKHIIFNKANETILWLFLQKHDYVDFVRNWKGAVYMNPLVANMGVSAALSLGFENLFLFGMDNGKVIDNTDSEATHPKASLIYKENLGDKKGYKFNSTSTLDIEGEGNFGRRVKTDYNYLGCARFIGRAIAYHNEEQGADISAVNCSDGLLIENTKGVRSTDLDFSHNVLLDKKAILDALFNLCFSIDVTYDEIKALLDSNEYNSICDEICNLLKQDVKTRNELCLRMQDICVFLYDLHSTRYNFYASLIDGSVESLFVMVMNTLYTIEDEAEAVGAAMQVVKRIIYLLEDSKTLFTMLPDYIQSEHLQKLDYTIGFDHEDSKGQRDFKEWYLFDDKQIAYLKGQVQPFVKITG